MLLIPEINLVPIEVGIVQGDCNLVTLTGMTVPILTNSIVEEKTIEEGNLTIEREPVADWPFFWP